MNAPFAMGVGARGPDGQLFAMQVDCRPGLIGTGGKGSHEHPLLCPRPGDDQYCALACGSRYGASQPLIDDTDSSHDVIVLQRDTLAQMVGTHGSGKVDRKSIAECPDSVVIEAGAKVVRKRSGSLVITP